MAGSGLFAQTTIEADSILFESPVLSLPPVYEGGEINYVLRYHNVSGRPVEYLGAHSITSGVSVKEGLGGKVIAAHAFDSITGVITTGGRPVSDTFSVFTTFGCQEKKEVEHLLKLCVQVKRLALKNIRFYAEPQSNVYLKYAVIDASHIEVSANAALKLVDFKFMAEDLQIHNLTLLNTSQRDTTNWGTLQLNGTRDVQQLQRSLNFQLDKENYGAAIHLKRSGPNAYQVSFDLIEDKRVIHVLFFWG